MEGGFWEIFPKHLREIHLVTHKNSDKNPISVFVCLSPMSRSAVEQPMDPKEPQLHIQESIQGPPWELWQSSG